MSAADTMSVQPTGAGRVVPSSSFDFAPLLREGDVVSWPQGPGEPLGLTGRLMATRHALPRARLLLGLLTQTSVEPAVANRFNVTSSEKRRVRKACVRMYRSTRSTNPIKK